MNVQAFSKWQVSLAIVESYNHNLIATNDHFKMVIDNLRQAVKTQDFARCNLLWNTFIKSNPAVISKHNPVTMG